MKIDNILEAEFEAKRFLSKIKDLKNSDSNGWIFKDKSKSIKRTDNSKETGAVKRASLDLTRVLSKLRNDTW